MNYKFKTKPYAHQIKALEKSWNKEVYALFMEMGTGKSKVLIDNISMLYDRGKINGALIIAPKGVYKNWQDSEIPIHMAGHIQKKSILWQANINKTQEAWFIYEGQIIAEFFDIDIIPPTHNVGFWRNTEDEYLDAKKICIDLELEMKPKSFHVHILEEIDFKGHTAVEDKNRAMKNIVLKYLKENNYKDIYNYIINYKM